MSLGVDTGGTFTDFVRFDGSRQLLPGKVSCSVPAGARLRLETPGGGFGEQDGEKQ